MPHGTIKTVQIAILGPLDVRTDDGEPCEVAGVRLRRLLIALALRPRRVATTSFLVDAVWGDEPPAEPGNALQALISRLRRAVPGIPLLTQSTGYTLDVADDDIDVGRFQRLVAGVNQADPQTAAKQLGLALDLWRGPALADVADQEFALGAVARLDEARLAALQDRLDADLRAGAAARIIPELEGLVASHPLREPLIRLLMLALAEAGDRSRALQVYQDTRERLADHLGVSPSAELTAAHVRILRSDLAVVPEVTAPSIDDTPRLTNLRAELTSFIGRDRDTRELESILSGSRLVTVLGAGGSGKTRLASHVARGQLDSGAAPDGAWMIEFASVSDPADLVPTVAAALSLRDGALVRGRSVRAADGTALERLLATLAVKATLLVFDNCEHLVGAIAGLADQILGACPSVRILATSREPLSLIGEAIWPIEPLALPPDAGAPDLESFDAIRLLAERAVAVRPGFAVTAENAEAVVRICRSLDGMPLAIELAAARLRTMSPQHLADRLSDRFAVLTGGSRTALPRHQTLRAVVDWSWELTDDAERRLWRRLSVFAGGATLDAVENVCGGDFDTLTALADKSLVIVRDGGSGPRFHLLETIKAYGGMRLDEAGERDPVYAAHADYFRGLAADARARLHGSEQLEWFAILEGDHDNLNAVIRYAVAAGDVRTAIEMVGDLGWYWWIRGHRREGLDLVVAALAVPDPEASTRVARATAYTVGALLAIDGAHDLKVAVGYFDRAYQLMSRLPETNDPLLHLVPPLRALFRMFSTSQVTDIDDMLLPVNDPFPWVAATALTIRAHSLLNLGRTGDAAAADFRAALRIYRDLGERWGMSFSMSSLASLSAWHGDLDPAIAYLEEALRCVVELGVWEDRIAVRLQLVRLLWLRGDHDRARSELAIGFRDANRFGAPESRAMANGTAAEIARLSGDLTAAGEFLADIRDIVAPHSVAPQVHSVMAGAAGFLASAGGDVAEARRRHRESLEIGVASVDAPVIGQALVGQADLALIDGDAIRAATLLGAGEAVRGAPDWSLPDAVRVAEQARAALDAVAFDEAYERGTRMSLPEVAELVGIPMPDQFRQRWPDADDPASATI